MDKRVITTIAAIALPLAVSFPALAQQAGATAQQAPPAAGQSTAAISLNRDQIVQLQQALNDNGFDAGQVDGVFDPQTIAALKRFQSKAGLQPTGQIDQQTLQLVGMAGSAPQAPAGGGPTTGQGGGTTPASPSPPPQANPNPDQR